MLIPSVTHKLEWKEHYTSATSQIHVTKHTINAHLHVVQKAECKK